MYLHSIAAYGDDIFDQMDVNSVSELRQVPEDELPLYHHSWGQSIRNECGLWDPEHPLTTRWHKFPDERDIRDGVDYSEDHPDSVSMKIMQHIHKKATAK